MGERRQVLTTCKSCHGGCGVIVTLEDDVIVHIQGNPDSTTRGTMCSKGLSSIQHIDNPYRIKHPMKRVGPKGSGKWERITLGRGARHHRRQDEGSDRRPRARTPSPSRRAPAAATTATP